MDKQQIRSLAQLAKLHFDEQQLDLFQGEFERMLHFVDQLGELETEGVAATTNAHAHQALREDVVRPSLTVEQVLENAPQSDGLGFLIPKVVG